MIDWDAVEFPQPPVVLTGEPAAVESNSPPCPWCNVPLEFTEDALEGISMVKICENGQAVVRCPACAGKAVIYPAGDAPVSTTGDGDVVVGAPAGGWRICRTEG